MENLKYEFIDVDISSIESFHFNKQKKWGKRKSFLYIQKIITQNFPKEFGLPPLIYAYHLASVWHFYDPPRDYDRNSLRRWRPLLSGNCKLIHQTPRDRHFVTARYPGSKQTISESGKKKRWNELIVEKESSPPPPFPRDYIRPAPFSFYDVFKVSTPNS